MYLDEKVEMPLYMECVETAINISRVQDAGGPVHVKLILEWDMPAKTQVSPMLAWKQTKKVNYSFSHLEP